VPFKSNSKLPLVLIVFLGLVILLVLAGSFWVVSENRKVYEHECASVGAKAVRSAPNTYICVTSDGRIVTP
jgi:flagellar basal body-associated protein FliL